MARKRFSYAGLLYSISHLFGYLNVKRESIGRTVGVICNYFVKLFEKITPEIVRPSKAVHSLFLRVSLFVKKFDKVADFFSFLRVKKSWIVS